jgi:predicted membrane-bound dolichyl-phosphate-mannose-protein mannosyltransferase
MDTKIGNNFQNSKNLSSKWEIILTMLLMTAILSVFWVIFKYPYIQDDWLIIGSIKSLGNVGYLTGIFSDNNSLFFRPVGQLYFLIIYNLFHLNTFGFHLIALVLHFFSSLMVVKIVKYLTNDPLTSWAAGFLYAVAIKIHMDSLLWMAGFYDIGGAFFFFLSMIFFIRKKWLLSGLAYCLALFTKESTIILLPVLLLYGLYMDKSEKRLGKKIWSQLKNIRVQLIALFIYVLVRLPLFTSLPVESNHPYRIQLTVEQFIANTILFINWSVEAINPFIDLPSMSIVAAILIASSILLIHMKNRTEIYKMVFLEGWIIIGIFPVIFLSDHFYRYYLTYSLPAFILIIILGLKELSSLFINNKKIIQNAIIGVTLVSIISSSYYFSEMDKQGFNIPTMQGSGNLIRKGAIVKMVQNYLGNHKPTLQPGTTFLFNWIPTVAFGKEQGPRIWYNDNSIQVYEIQHVGRDNVGIFPITERMESSTNKFLELDKTIFLAFHGDYIREVSEDQFFKK